MTHWPLRSSRVLLLAALLVACRGGDNPRVASRALLAGIPAMPRSVPISNAAGSDAVEAGYTTADSPDSVAAWYRRWFLQQGWRITADLPASGGVTVAVEKERRPVWLIIRPLANHQGSMFSVVSAGVDSAAKRGAHN
jgi:hypothetical protein